MEEKKILIWLFMIPIGSLWINDFKLLFRALFVVLFGLLDWREKDENLGFK
jgi:hypothetical protein